VRILAGVFTVVFVFVTTWVLTYPDGDPKNIKYVLWKAGLYQMNLDIAAGTMIGDGKGRDNLVGQDERATARQIRVSFDARRGLAISERLLPELGL
jgi:hypothetical protein